MVLNNCLRCHPEPLDTNMDALLAHDDVAYNIQRNVIGLQTRQNTKYSVSTNYAHVYILLGIVINV